MQGHQGIAASTQPDLRGMCLSQSEECTVHGLMTPPIAPYLRLCFALFTQDLLSMPARIAFKPSITLLLTDYSGPVADSPSPSFTGTPLMAYR